MATMFIERSGRQLLQKFLHVKESHGIVQIGMPKKYMYRKTEESLATYQGMLHVFAFSFKKGKEHTLYDDWKMKMLCDCWH